MCIEEKEVIIAPWSHLCEFFFNLAQRSIPLEDDFIVQVNKAAQALLQSMVSGDYDDNKAVIDL